MAKLERKLHGNFDRILADVERVVLQGSISATLEDKADYWSPHGGRCSVRVFERYSYMGNNRVSMNVTLFQPEGGPVCLCAITSGGSQATFFKINTLGEEAFLDTLRAGLNL